MGQRQTRYQNPQNMLLQVRRCKGADDHAGSNLKPGACVTCEQRSVAERTDGWMCARSPFELPLRCPEQRRN